jgi:hypothetical protein
MSNHAASKEMVKANPYPTFEAITALLEKQRHLALIAEYGRINHDLCKTIYENCTDKEKVIEAGKAIHARGGIQALQCNFYVLDAVFRGVDPDQGREAISELEWTLEAVTPDGTPGGLWRK